MNKVNISAEFEMGYCNGYMHCKVFNNDDEIFDIKHTKDQTLRLDFYIHWPTVLTFELSNKNINSDTVVGNDGFILQNKYMLLKKMTVNGFPLIESALYNITMFKGENEIFWDDNGTATIELTKNNPTRWLLSLNNTIYFRENA